MKRSRTNRLQAAFRNARDRIFWGIGAHLAKRRETSPGSYATRRRLLELLNIYRLLVAGATVTIAAAPPVARALNIDSPLVVGMAGLCYLLLGLFTIAAITKAKPSLEVQSQVEPLVDLVAAAVIVQATGADLGILAFLLILPVITAAATARSARRAGFFAALATLIVLAAALGTQVGRALPVTLYTEAGLFGVGIFVLALIAHALAGRLVESEALATRRGIALRELDAVNRQIIAQLRTGVVITSPEGEVLRTNPAARQLLDSVATSAIQQAANQPDGGRTHHVETGDGTQLLLTMLPLGEPGAAGRLVFIEDANAASEQAQSLKLAALGRLTAAIAHQIRNPLAAITHAGQLLGESTTHSAREKRLVDIICHQSARLDGVVESILQLSRRSSAKSRSFELGRWLTQFLDMYRELHPERARQIARHGAERRVEVHFDPGHLEHILTNLVDNAFIHGSSPQGVQVATGVFAARPFLEVRDHGPGLAQPERLFEPFATTRPAGTGLGLYLARELAAANGARLTARSGMRGGAFFRLEFSGGSAWLE